MKHQMTKFGFCTAARAVCICFFISNMLLTTQSYSQDPTITVQFANPQHDCTTGNYCVDVEFLSDTDGAELFGMNVRFFYDDDVLELIGFSGFQGGYGAVPPNPPYIATSNFAGPAWFNFNGPAEFINGAIQLINPNAPPLLLNSTSGTKIFQICFTINDPSQDIDNFCPSLVWDLEQDPENGGFLVGDDGVVITIVNPDPNYESAPAIEQVNQFNWMYTGSGSAPFGEPVENICISLNCNQGSVCGIVKDDLENLLGNVVLQLYADVNQNSAFDSGDTLFSTEMSDTITGAYCFEELPSGYFIINEQQPTGYGSFSDFDATPDSDGDDSSDGADNEIPVFVSQSENDLDNNFIDIVCPLQLPAYPYDTLCDGSSLVFETSELNIGAVSYFWEFGSGASPDTSLGIGPHVIEYDTTAENQNPGAQVNLTISKNGCTDLTGQVSNVLVRPFPDASIETSTTPLCYYTERVFEPQGEIIPGASYFWNFGEGASMNTAEGYGPHTIYYTTTGLKTVRLSIYPNGSGAQCADSSQISFTVNSCPGNVTGRVKTSAGTGIGGVQLKVFADADQDGYPDNNIVVKSGSTVVAGNYSLVAITPGDYVVVQTQPSGWISVDDGDTSPDGDNGPNPDSLDNIIPVTVVANMVDAHNDFVESAAPGTLTGSVFVDEDQDGIPGINEGLEGVHMSLYPDQNKDGLPDNGSPMGTEITSSSGEFVFEMIPVGNYVVAETNPMGYISVEEFDFSQDLDTVNNAVDDDDLLPVTLTNGEHDQHNYFIDEVECQFVVANLNDSGTGSLRKAIECAEHGDTILFHPSLSGQTIFITTSRISISKDLILYSTLQPPITIKSVVQGLFDIEENAAPQFRGMKIISGIEGNPGVAFNNLGNLILHDVSVVRNQTLPAGHVLIRNVSGSHLEFRGVCHIDWD